MATVAASQWTECKTSNNTLEAVLKLLLSSHTAFNSIENTGETSVTPWIAEDI